MGMTKIFLKAAKEGATISNGFEDLNAFFKEIENQSLPFYYRLARFIAMKMDRQTAEEKGFVFNEDGEPVFSKKINGNIDRYLIEFLGVSSRTLRNWKSLEDYAMLKRKNRNLFFKLAFLLGLNTEKTNEMFNKLFAHPAFIREPEALIFMRCLDSNKTFEDAQAMVAEYHQKSQTIPANEIFERIHTADIYNFDCTDDDKYTTYLAVNRKQFEIANVTAVEKIKSIAEKYITRDFYAEKLENIDYSIDNDPSRIDTGWMGMEEYDESFYENEAKRTEEIKAILNCFPLFISVLAKGAPGVNGRLAEAFYNSADCSKNIDEEIDLIIFSEEFSAEIKQIDIKDINSAFLRRAFLDFPNIQMLYDEDKLNNPEFAKFTKYEDIRKLLIMMEFLEFHTEDYNGTFEDICNLHLAQCGFGELYAPNPFDFMFMLSSNAADPIDAFRELWDYAFSLGTINE